MNSAFSIRTMRPGELELALEWARQEGWNPGLDDAQPFCEADPSGFLIATMGEVPIGCISVVKYGESFAFLGLYIVHPQFRGRGYGKALWDAGMATAEGRTIGLDGVLARQEDYRRSGFELAYRTLRYSGVVAAPPRSSLAAEVVSPERLASLQAYDAEIFPEQRASFLASWCGTRDTRKSVVLGEGDGICGYGTIRQCHEGYKIGPLFADSVEAAEAVLAGLLPTARGAQVQLDVPVSNSEAIGLVTRLGLAPGFETARMYRGPAPSVPLDRVFGTTTLELG